VQLIQLDTGKPVTALAWKAGSVKLAAGSHTIEVQYW
jgi:hypothetical protein